MTCTPILLLDQDITVWWSRWLIVFVGSHVVCCSVIAIHVGTPPHPDSSADACTVMTMLKKVSDFIYLLPFLFFLVPPPRTFRNVL